MKSFLAKAIIASVGLAFGVVSLVWSAGELPFPEAPRISKEEVKNL